jgi:hypothetical protein
MNDKQETPLATRPNSKPLAPLQLSRKAQDLTDEAAWELANRIKNSSIIPKDFIGKPDNIFIAVLMGREVGLHPIQAVQNIMVVNGRPTMWGDSLPALVYASGLVEKFEEEYDEKTKTAICTVRRKGDTKDHVQKFSWDDAVKAAYDKKPGPWQTSPKRMQQMRARSFALRDKFADALKGICMREEVEDYEQLDNATSIAMPKEVVDITHKAAAFSAQEAEVVTSEPAPEPETPKAQSKEDPRIATAKKKFFETYSVPAESIDAYLAWSKLTTFSEMYPKLQEVWKALKGGTTTVETEFGRFMPKKDEKPNSELDFE